MIKTLNPYNNTNTEKTAEIMSRYRPIAPRPETPANSAGCEVPSSFSQKIKDSPYLRNLWPQLQARPTRTRKRGRSALSPTTFKRQRPHHVFGFSSPCHVTSPAKNLSFDGFAHALSQLPLPPTNFDAVNTTSLMTLPLLPYPPPLPSLPIVTNSAVTPVPVPVPVPAEFELIKPCGGGEEEKFIDLNTVAEVLEEKDLLQQLQGSAPAPPAPTPINVIAPQPVRPVGSSISVGSINADPNLAPVQPPKKPEDVEEEVESETLPAIISDSHNKVRMANSAYKEMVGQPECPWLDSMVVAGEGRFGGSSSKRISGEVILHLSDSGVPVSSNGFSCWVRIEWGNNMNKHATNAFCDVIKLSCESKDYLFTWRFHTHTKEASQSSCNA